MRRRDREEETFDQELPIRVPRLAPIARRTDISRCRATARAMSRLATFEQAMRRIRPAIAINTSSAVEDRLAHIRVAGSRAFDEHATLQKEVTVGTPSASDLSVGYLVFE